MFDALRATRAKPLQSCRSLRDLPKLPRRGKIPAPRKQWLVQAWFSVCGAACGVCGVEMVRPRPNQPNTEPNVATIDHIIARCLGGTNAPSNLRVICAGCNTSKAVDEAKALRRRQRMYRRRAIKAAQTRARNKAHNRAREATRAAA